MSAIERHNADLAAELRKWKARAKQAQAKLDLPCGSCHHFIEPDTVVTADRRYGSIYLVFDGGDLTLNLDWDNGTKAGALAQLAEWVAVVEALPDDVDQEADAA